jgi:hypothetical protein
MPRALKSEVVLDRPGYFGKRRPEIAARYDAEYGVGGWDEAWQVNELLYSFDEAVTLYDDAYLQHLSEFSVADWVCTFRECYDSDPSNIGSGVRHDEFASPRHLQDVSIRRALVRMGVWFCGTELLHVRGPETNGHRLMPGNVPFHRPSLILKNGGPLRDWMRPGSVEAFWQANKVIIRNLPF